MSLIDLFSKKKTCGFIVNSEGKIAEKYQHFKEFLIHNHDALGTIAELEQTYHGENPINIGWVMGRYHSILESTLKLTQALNDISGGRYSQLADVCGLIDGEIALLFKPATPVSSGNPFVLNFEDLRPEMMKIAGAKATNLATVRNCLSIPIPHGFVVTTAAFERFLGESGLATPIDEMLVAVTTDMTEEMEAGCMAIQEMISKAEVPSSVADEIFKAYEILEAKTNKNVRIAMRSSAVGEDTEASFAGQYVTELNVTRKNLLTAYKSVLASKYAPRAVLYRLHYGLDDRETPMCVAGVAMIDSKASGILYTVDPALPESSDLKISSIWGLGEHLVDGGASPDILYIDRKTNDITQRNIGRKEYRLVNLESNGTILEEVPVQEKLLPSINDDTTRVLSLYGLTLEEYFKGPQDVEWTIDSGGNLYILQCRPLGLAEAKREARATQQLFPDHPILVSGGKRASTGTATGFVFIAGTENLASLPQNAILVAKTASPEYAKLIGKVKGIITEIGSVASHLASVTREFGVPLIVDAGSAISSLNHGDEITMVADTATVYKGIVPELTTNARSLKRFMFESPVHRKVRAVLDRISPLNLVDPKDPAFSPAGCRTIHDIIRFSHEYAMKEMFTLSDSAGSDATSVVLKSNIPLFLRLIDLGEGLKSGLTVCDTIIPDHIESIPLKSLWSGFSHPGITWAGSINVNFSNFMTLIASNATSELREVSNWESYAVITKEYLNMSARFGYHYATVDALCSDEPDQNHVSLQFSGGVGTYYGRSLRIAFLGNVLGRIGFTLAMTGDLLDATLSGHDRKSLEGILDQLGRLLASSRLLDMAISDQAHVDRMTEAFFRGDYDFLNNSQSMNLQNFYTHTGDWKPVVEDGRTLCLQDGSRWGSSISTGMADLMGKMVGAKYQEFLDNVGAHYYFPLAIAKNSAVSDGEIEVRVKPLSGRIDRAGGLVFGLRDIGNYFVLRVNALEDNFVLFEFINDRRFQRATIHKKFETARWYRIRVEISGHSLRGFLDDELLIGYTAERLLNGYIGIWTKADSVTYFDDLAVYGPEGKCTLAF